MNSTGIQEKTIDINITEASLDSISERLDIGIVFAEKRENNRIVLANKGLRKLLNKKYLEGKAEVSDIFEVDGENNYTFLELDTVEGEKMPLVEAIELDEIIILIVYDILKALKNNDVFLKMMELNRHLINTFHSYGDETLMIANGDGVIEFAGEKTARDCGVSTEWLVGKNVYDMESQGVFTPSVTKKVLETKQPSVVIQKVKAGGERVSVGMPLEGKSGRIKKVLSITRDYSTQIKISKIIAELQGTATLSDNETESDSNRDNDNIITCSDKMLEIKLLIKMIAPTKATVLITGETGTGKEVVARNIHNFSDRKNMPFIKVNCGAIAHSLMESELFGYEEGSFTGASRGGKIGLIEAASGGTLFLDEISELPIDQQVKLLHVLQEKMLIKVGGTEIIDVDVRIIAATNKNLEEEVEKGNFREDLYYRLNVIPIDLPTLKNRREDVSLLAKYFFNRFCDMYNKDMRFSNKAISALEKYAWPGNIRELENTIERLVLTTSKPIITVDSLPEKIMNSDEMSSAVKVSRIVKIDVAIREVEKELIKMAINEYGTTTKAAEALGINQSTVSRKAATYGIGSVNKKENTETTVF